MITLYGIPNCDTVKKARVWLDSHALPYIFHDFKKAGVPADRLAVWTGALGWEKLLNRQGRTWRKLDAATQASVVDADSAQAVMVAHASTIKRPVVEWGGDVLTVGFSPQAWADKPAP
ncbi:MAG: arsenate reductase [Ferruginibacter sp.]|nr:arsenate reductase [Rhodoferax sp.]